MTVAVVSLQQPYIITAAVRCHSSCQVLQQLSGVTVAVRCYSSCQVSQQLSGATVAVRCYSSCQVLQQLSGVTVAAIRCCCSCHQVLLQLPSGATVAAIRCYCSCQVSQQLSGVLQSPGIVNDIYVITECIGGLTVKDQMKYLLMARVHPEIKCWSYGVSIKARVILEVELRLGFY